MSSIFTQIIEGKIPCHKIYEDEHTFAFLDIHPLQPGHVLVVPKKEVEFLWDLDDETYHAVMSTAKKIALHIREVMSVSCVGEKVVGEDVPHAHIHLIPFTEASAFDTKPDMNAELDHDALVKIAEKLAF